MRMQEIMIKKLAYITPFIGSLPLLAAGQSASGLNCRDVPAALNVEGVLIVLFPYLLSVFTSVGVGVYAWQHRKVAGAVPFAVRSLAQASATVGYIFELLSPDLQTKIFWDSLQFPGFFVAPLALLAFAFGYTGRKPRHPQRFWMLLTIPLLLYMLLVLTDDSHRLIYLDAHLIPGEPFDALVYDFTFFTKAISLYLIGILLLCFSVLIAKFRSQILYRAQIVIITIGTLFPMIGSALTIAGVTFGFQRDTSPFTFAIGNLIIAWGLFRYRLLDITPIARDKVIEGMSDAVVVLDVQNRVVDLNPAARKIFNSTPLEAIGQSIDQIFSNQPELMEQLRNRDETRLEIALGSDTEPQFFDVSLSLLHHRRGYLTGRLIVLRDLTERVQVETALEQAKEVAWASQRAAEAANRAKSVFLANMSHELRTPLNSILGYAQILKRDPSTPTKQQHGLDVIEQSGSHLLGLINEVLDFAKIESGKLELDETDFSLPALLKSVSEIIRVRAEQKGITFCLELPSADLQVKKAELPMTVHGDERRLRQVLLNLLDNAVKFTEQGRVTFKIFFWKRPGMNGTASSATGRQQPADISGLRFEIQDTGVGIAPQALDTIFAPFRQAGDQASDAKGTGLGLTISRNLVELMGSTLHVKSQIGAGSKFWFDITLPVVRSGMEWTLFSTGRIVGIEGESPTVLIVDDNQNNRTVLKGMLSPLGFLVVEAINGRDGLAKTVAERPDAIIIDLLMPEMDGFELIRRIRQSPGFQQPMIIATSASAYKEDHQRSIALGGDAFLPKPVQAETLLEQLSHHLNLRWTTREQTGGAAPLMYPPAETIQELHEFALMGDINELTERVNKLEISAPHFRPFAVQVQRFLTRYQLDELSEWLAPHKENKET